MKIGKTEASLDIRAYIWVSYSSRSVHTILTPELKFKKDCARWVRHFLTKEKKATRVKIYKK